MAWKIDAAHSSIEFSVKHMMITTVRGRFGEFDGNLSVDGSNLLNSTVEGYIQTASVDTRDANRDGHLRSADFFDAERFPRMTFRSTKLEKAGDGQYKLTGDLTIKDVTRSITFDVSDDGRGKDPWGNQRWGVSATAAISRKDFGLNWNVALETGGWLVGDQVKISAEVELIAVPDAAPEEAAAVGAAA
jgi:polyisoprenoid-binding protein YceI